jgi:RTX calcium-binding nonapeptide repeat (4 copies)
MFEALQPATRSPMPPRATLYGGSIGPVTSPPHAPDPISGTNGSDDLFGTSADDLIAGLDGKDWLYGLAGNDILDGGLGADVMAGGKGDDIYYVDDDDGDVIWEWGGEGTDTVLLESGSGHGFDLPTAVENLDLAGSVREGYGNDLDNVSPAMLLATSSTVVAATTPSTVGSATTCSRAAGAMTACPAATATTF